MSEVLPPVSLLRTQPLSDPCPDTYNPVLFTRTYVLSYRLSFNRNSLKLVFTFSGFGEFLFTVSFHFVVRLQTKKVDIVYETMG